MCVYSANSFPRINTFYYKPSQLRYETALRLLLYTLRTGINKNPGINKSSSDPSTGSLNLNPHVGDAVPPNMEMKLAMAHPVTVCIF